MATGSTLLVDKDKASDKPINSSAALREKSFYLGREICIKFSSRPDFLLCMFAVTWSMVLILATLSSKNMKLFVTLLLWMKTLI